MPGCEEKNSWKILGLAFLCKILKSNKLVLKLDKFKEVKEEHHFFTFLTMFIYHIIFIRIFITYNFTITK